MTAAAIVIAALLVAALVAWVTWELLYRPAEEAPYPEWLDAFDRFKAVHGREPSTNELIDYKMGRWIELEVEEDER